MAKKKRTRKKNPAKRRRTRSHSRAMTRAGGGVPVVVVNPGKAKRRSSHRRRPNPLFRVKRRRNTGKGPKLTLAGAKGWIKPALFALGGAAVAVVGGTMIEQKVATTPAKLAALEVAIGAAGGLAIAAAKQPQAALGFVGGLGALGIRQAYAAFTGASAAASAASSAPTTPDAATSGGTFTDPAGNTWGSGAMGALYGVDGMLGLVSDDDYDPDGDDDDYDDDSDGPAFGLVTDEEDASEYY